MSAKLLIVESSKKASTIKGMLGAGFTVKATGGHILEMPVYRRFTFRLNTAGVTEIEWHPARRKWVLIRYNQDTGC